MKNIIRIIKKEFERFFKDKRLVLSTIILPGLLIYLLYSFMGDGFMASTTIDTDYVSPIYVCNMPENLQPLFSAEIFNIETTTNFEEAKTNIKNQEKDLLIIFPENFEAQMLAYDSTNPNSVAPNIEIYFNSVNENSLYSYEIACNILDQYENYLANKFDINNEITADLASQEDVSGKIFAMLLPMLMMTFMFSGCMSVAPESIAGEKERGTLATLLVTPLKRKDLAIGKIISLSLIALLSGISSFTGTVLSLPKITGTEIETVTYGIGDYIALLLVILSTILIFVSLISILSAYAKSVKEATTLVTPLMIVVMLVGVSSIFSGGTDVNSFLYLIPVYNTVQCMTGIFAFNYSILNCIITILTNIIISMVLCYILTQMFNSEKIMFNK